MIKLVNPLIAFIIIICGLTGCGVHIQADLPDIPAAPESIERLGYEGGNVGAGGLVCGGDDGYIYYRSESDSWKLYKAKPDGSSKTKVSDRVIEGINVLDGWVYFIDHFDGNSIYKVRTDGTEEIKLVDGWCYDLYAAESGLYFDKRDENNHSQVCRADLDGENFTMLVSDMTVAYYYKGNIYYKNSQELGVYDITAKSGKSLVKGETYNVSVDDSGIYYWAVDKEEFHRMDLNGDMDSIIQKGGDYFNYHQGNLYYMGISSNKNGPCHVINRLDLSNNETTLLLEEANEYFDTHGNWLGITFRQWLEHPETVDPSMIDEKDGGLKNGFNESVGYVYAVGEHLYMRAALRESLLITGKVDCIARLDEDVIIWD